jgi:hypothetical protein
VTPYREAPSEARWVCLACESRSSWSGACADCGVERAPLADARVRDELVAAFERRLHTRAGKEQRLISVALFLVTTPLAWAIGWPIGLIIWFLVAFGGTQLGWSVAARVPGSALNKFRARRRFSAAHKAP